MKSKKLVLVAIFSLLVILLIIGNISVLGAEKKVYSVGLDIGCAPMAFIDEKGDIVGLDVDILNWIAKEMGFEVKFAAINWDLAIPSLTGKKHDIIASGMSITEERKKVIGFTIPYLKNIYNIVALEDSDLNIITAFSGDYTLAITRGHSGQDWIEKNLIEKGVFTEDKIVITDSSPMSINTIVTKRADFTLVDEVFAESLIKGKPVIILGKIYPKGEETGFGIRKDDQELKEILDEGLTRLMKSPEWDELMAKWLSS